MLAFELTSSSYVIKSFIIKNLQNVLTRQHRCCQLLNNDNYLPVKFHSPSLLQQYDLSKHATFKLCAAVIKCTPQLAETVCNARTATFNATLQNVQRRGTVTT